MASALSTGDPIQRLIRELSKLPGIGQKTATRLAFFVLRAPAEQAQSLARAPVSYTHLDVYKRQR